MGGLSRYDFFRILVPGGTVLFLFDLVVRVVTATPSVHAASLTTALSTVERPAVGVVVAFGTGIILYYLDLAYSAPQFFEYIPSSYLSERLGKERYSTDALSLFFLASDKLLPPEMRERALLYGALYRTGFQVVLFTLASAAVLPVVILLHLKEDSLAFSDRTFRPIPIVVSVAIIGAFAAPFVRELLKKKADRRWPARSLFIPLGVLISGISFLWIDIVTQWLPFQPHYRSWLVGSTSATLTIALILRLIGPPTKPS